MSVKLAENSTGTGLLEILGEYHEHAAATEPRAFHWSGTYIRRWLPVTDFSRAGSFSGMVLSRLVSAGRHDIVTLLIHPHSVDEALFLPHGPALVQGLRHRIVLGPSTFHEAWSRGSNLENAVPQEIGDPVFSQEFLAAFRLTLGQIDRLAGLRKGWDSYQGGTISTDARKGAARFLNWLYSLDRSAPVPVVGPSATGAVALQWYLPKAEVLVEIGPDSCEYYVARPDDDGVLFEASAGVEKLREVAVTLLPFLR